MSVIFHGNGLVWDPERQRALCEFKDGIVVLDDDRAIAIMRRNAFVEEATLAKNAISSVDDDVRVITSVETYTAAESEPKKSGRKAKAEPKQEPAE